MKISDLVVGSIESLRKEKERKKLMKEAAASFVNFYKTQRAFEEYNTMCRKLNEELNNHQ